MRMRTGLVAAVMLLACELPFANVTRAGVEPYEPLAEYPTFWQETEACSGAEGDLARVSWFRAASIMSNGQVARGLWEPPHRITIWRGLEDDRDTVRHEMLHDLLRGDPDHRLPAWSDCGLLLP